MLDKIKGKTKGTIIQYSDGTDTVLASRITLTVDGIKPLLTHNPESMGFDKAPGKGSRIPEAEIEAEAGVYRLPDGTCAIKGEAFRGSLLGAASAWKAKAKRTMKSLLSHVTVIEDLIPLMRHDGTPIKDYIIDRRRAIIQRNGIIRCRPCFPEWSCTFTIEYDPELIGKEPRIIADILQDAGNRIGVGDFRPGRNGPFGRFRVRSYEINE
jgi:hypothetical protein